MFDFNICLVLFGILVVVFECFELLMIVVDLVKLSDEDVVWFYFCVDYVEVFM